MTPSFPERGSPPADHPVVAARPSALRWLRHDPLLIAAGLPVGLLLSYQLGVILAQPSWIGPATDWLRAALAWPQLLIVVLVGVWLTRHRMLGAASIWMMSIAFLSYAVTRTLWTAYSQLTYRGEVPFPTLPDLFFVLQYPFFFVALILSPRVRVWSLRLRVILDGVLVMGAATALSWYFLLAPIYAMSGISPLARAISLAYPAGDLFLLLGLTRQFMLPSRIPGGNLTLSILCLAIGCLVCADSWAAALLIAPPHVYRTGNVPDLFWSAFYLLIPLACLVWLRCAQWAAKGTRGSAEQALTDRQVQWRDLLAGLRFLFPFLAALLASATIAERATMLLAFTSWRSLIAPFTVSLGLLLLVIVRQAVVFMERAQLQRERDAAQASALALRTVNCRMEAFLAIASHELKTPLTSLQGNTELLARSLAAVRQPGTGAAGLARFLERAERLIERSKQGLQRLGHLVDDLLDDAGIQQGRLAFRMELCDLATIVEEVVEAQRLLASDRMIGLEGLCARPVPVIADAGRISQVVTNYLSNACKYLRDDQPIAVRLEVEGDQARVSVHDEGVGLPVADQVRIWERFYRAEGVTVQSGSRIGLGIGLYVSRTIVGRHRGQVGVQSTPGRGATFWFTLPLALASP